VNYITEIEKLVPIPASLKGSDESYEPMRQIIEDAGMDVIKNVEKFNPKDLNLFTRKQSVITQTPNADVPSPIQGIDLPTGIVQYVERRGKTCIEIDPAMKNMANDITSLSYATEEYPVFYKENKRLYILPEPSVNNTTIESSYAVFKESDATIEISGQDFPLTDIVFSLVEDPGVNDKLAALTPHGIMTGNIIKLRQAEEGETEWLNPYNFPCVRKDSNTITIPLLFAIADLYVDSISSLTDGTAFVPTGRIYPEIANSFAYMVDRPYTRAETVNTGNVSVTDGGTITEVPFEITFDFTDEAPVFENSPTSSSSGAAS